MAIRWRKADAAILIGLCLFASMFSLNLVPSDQDEAQSWPPSRELRRNLRAQSTRRVFNWAKNYLQPVTVTPEPLEETVLFWHIPKSGGTTVKAIYECLGETLASRAGSLPRFGHDQDEEVIAFHPWREDGPVYVNVDTSRPEGILHAQEMGLVPSGMADMIITGFPVFAIEHLYDGSHKGRALGVFRHPVERLVSKFYYLQTATWERTYHPGWKHMSVVDFAGKNNDNNFMVKKLARQKMNEEVTEEDLRVAMKTVRQHFIVGLVNQMEETIHRFNIVMGIDESTEENKECMDQFFGSSAEKKNSNSHPTYDAGSPEWEALAKKNALDIKLYDYIVQLFEEQQEMINSYSDSITVEEERS